MNCDSVFNYFFKKRKNILRMANRLEPRFVNANSRNLPKVDTFMVFEFIFSDDKFNAPEVRGVKVQR